MKLRALRVLLGTLLGWVLLSGAAALPTGAQQGESLIIRFIDVGAGEATWLTTPDQRTILVDCGPLSYGKQLAQDLQSAGVSGVDLLVLSNAHPEAVGGCVEILRRLPIGTVLVPAQLANSPAWKLFLAELSSTNTRVVNAVARADPDAVGGVVLHVLNPSDTGQSGPLDEYDDSTVLVIDYAGTRVLLAGDIHLRGEIQARQAGLLMYAPFAVLRVADHASKASTSQRFLDDTQPQYAVVSYGLDPAAPAPDENTIFRLRSSVPNVLTTARDGTLVAQIDAYGRVRVNPESFVAAGT